MKKAILLAAACLWLLTVTAQKKQSSMKYVLRPETSRAHYWLEELIRFGLLPNNVFEPEQIQNNAAYLAQLLQSQGFDVDMWPTPSGKPYVYAHLETDPSLPTLLFYSHYDGVPIDRDYWDTDPYRPVIKDGQGNTVTVAQAMRTPRDCRIYGRSVADSKNAILSLLAALDLLQQKGERPRVNIKFLLDGEEELESPFLYDVVRAHAPELKADLAVSASGETHQSGLPTIAFGVRGILTLEMILHTAASTMHSGHFGNFTPNAALELARVLTSFKDASGRVLITGFYDDVSPLSPEERNAIAGIPPIEERVQQQFGIAKTEMGLSLQESINLPTFNVRGLQAGYTGEKAANIIPSQARASIDIRLVEGMDPDRVYQSVCSTLLHQGFALINGDPGAEELFAKGICVQVNKTGGFAATKTDIHAPMAQRLLQAVQRSTAEPWVVEPTEGGSLNLGVFGELGLPLVTLPVSNFDCNQHTHNENLRVDFFLRGISIFEHLLLLS